MTEKYDYSKDTLLHSTQQCELEIMKFVHNFCIENNLRYSLAYGTAIGAVRHKGFIPWDDDIDIVMPREDYNKFIELWKNSDEYILVNKDTDSDFTQNFTKIKKNHSTFLQEADIGRNYHKGVFVDIFPADRIPKSVFMKFFYYINCLIALLYTRNHNSKNDGVINFIENCLLKISEKKKLKFLSKANKNIQKYNNNKKFNYIFLSTLKTCKWEYPSDIFDRINTVSFENCNFFLFDDFDLHLKTVYGDYMKFPPKEQQRWTHSPLIVSFNKKIDELDNL